VRTEHRIATLVEQRGVHGRGSGVDEAFAVERVEQHLVLQRVQGQGWARASRARLPGPDEGRTVQPGLLARRRTPPQAHDLASGAQAKVRGELLCAGRRRSGRIFSRPTGSLRCARIGKSVHCVHGNLGLMDLGHDYLFAH
jgi:hypothetical protein